MNSLTPVRPSHPLEYPLSFKRKDFPPALIPTPRAFSHSFGRQLLEKTWSKISLLTHWCFQLMLKITRCILRIQPKQPQQLIQLELNQNHLNPLFNQPIVYEEFRDAVLHYRIDNELFFNNYDSTSYLNFKCHDTKLLDHCKSEQDKELKAGIACYEAIVDLYVQRIIQYHPELKQASFLPALRMVALTIAIKITEKTIFNSDFQAFLPSEVNIKTLHSMESAFLEGIQWDISIAELLLDSIDVNKEAVACLEP